MSEDNLIEQWTYASGKCEKCINRHRWKTIDLSQEKTLFRGGLFSSEMLGPLATVVRYDLEKIDENKSRIVHAEAYKCEDIECAINVWHAVAILSLKKRLLEDRQRKIERNQEAERRNRLKQKIPSRKKKRKRTLH